MGILLVRHSDAIEGSRGLDDAARWLSAAGRARARAAAELLRDKGLAFDRFVTSPRMRAVQTAEIYAQVLGFRGPVEALPELSFSEPADRAVRALGELEGNVAAFGHMPTIVEIVQELGNDPRARPLGTSEAVWIDAGKIAFRLGPQD